MKVVKYILGTLFIFSSLGAIVQGNFLVFLFLMILGLVFLPLISDLLKEKFKLWQNKAVRYVFNIILFFIVGMFIPRDLSVSEKKVTKSNNLELENDKKKNLELSNFNFKKCNYGGGDFYIIPNMIAADVYITFQKRGFKINKNIKNEGTDIYCELSTSDIKHDVIITGCSPDNIIYVEAMITDYSGNNLEAAKSFIGYVATLQYKDSNPEEARKWIDSNINNDGAQTTIGGVTLSINFKSKYSKSFSMKVE